MRDNATSLFTVSLMGHSAPPRPTGDPQWAQYALPGTPAHPRAYDVRADTVVDCVTGLEWELRIDAMASGLRTRDASAAYCNTLILGGAEDWRVPSTIELMTLVDYDVAPPEPTIAAAFPGTPAELFWTSSPVSASIKSGWYVDFGSGDAAPLDLVNRARARCVR